LQAKKGGCEMKKMFFIAALFVLGALVFAQQIDSYSVTLNPNTMSQLVLTADGSFTTTTPTTTGTNIVSWGSIHIQVASNSVLLNVQGRLLDASKNPVSS